MEKFGICLHTLIPVRKTNSECDEMVTQIIFGETYIITEIIENWAKVLITFDNYIGWIDIKLINYIDKNKYIEINKQTHLLCSKLVSQLTNTTTNKTISIVAGSTLPVINKSKSFSINNTYFKHKEAIYTNPSTTKNILKIAYMFENAPYLWGGRTFLGIDCSGFSQIVYKIAGIHLNRDASQQAKQGKKINSLECARPGDLAFFSNKKGNITHVGIIINENNIIHASGWVRIDTIGEKGIFNSELNKYSHDLYSIRRIIE